MWPLIFACPYAESEKSPTSIFKTDALSTLSDLVVTHTFVSMPYHFIDANFLKILGGQGNDVGTQYRSGIYFYTPEQENAAKESLERQQKVLNRKIVTEILPAKKFYPAEEYHQQYLEKGGRFGFKQSANKGCNDPIRCYG